MIEFYPQTWEQLIESERRLRQEIHDYEALRNTDNLRGWYAVASHIMFVCASSSRLGSLPLSPPAELFAVISGMMDSFSRGIIPQAVSDVTGRGRPQASKLEETDIGWATIYAMAVRSGAISDPTPVKTICDAYHVERQTAQTWARLRPPATWLPVEDLSSSFIVEQMRSAAAQYSRAGRSSTAIEKRARHSK